MQDHLQPKPNQIAERYRFYKRDRKTGETVADYIAILRKLSEHCEFGDKLEEYLRDRLVCGLNSERVQQKLLATQDLNLKKAMDIAIGFETASKEARSLQSSGGVDGERIDRLGAQFGSNRVGGQGFNQGRKECYRCGSLTHLANGCPFRNKECFGCGRKGHLKCKCQKSEGEEKKGKNSGKQVGRDPIGS